MEAANPTRFVEESLKVEEAKRRKREGIVILVTALMVAALIFFEVQLPDVTPEYSLGSNIVFFFLINVNIILLGLLVFLVVRNLVKLVVEHKRRMLGSRLQARLVLAFVGLALVPSVLLFMIAGGLLRRSFDRWFDSKVESALQGSLEIGQTYYQNSANNALFYARDKRILGVVVVDYYVPKSISKRAIQISQSYEQYKYLTFLKAPVKNSYLLTMLLITLVIIFAATWCGIYLSKGITVPIQKLAEGTHQVALGNWDYKIEAGGDDEIGVLVNSFNQMTGDLKQIKLELERRGNVVQTLLANIAAGVVSVDPSGKITTWNKAAEQILGVQAERALGKQYRNVFDAEPLRGIREMVDSVKGCERVGREMKLSLAEQLRNVVVSAAALHEDNGSILGVILYVEDIN